ncbi:major facilitator superfamily domain-containing protein [Phyllosticta citrichinensis]|uniref:Major facilitator superfamily domain-containing protein n=1 Tax=Phyllosticta citrichinensis TaxID=1130410 RepID=A0ABR1Y242_9PEZI
MDSSSASLSETDPEKGVQETTGTEQPGDIEEGNWPTGWRPWTTLAACFFLMFNSWGLVNAYGTFASYYKDVLLPNQDALFFNLFGATECFMVLLLSGVVGRLLDGGHARILLGIGAVITPASFFLLSVVNGEGERGDGNVGLIWLTHGFLDGLGMSFFFVSSSQIAATWFHKRKSLAIGIVASGASISGLVYPIMLRFLITKVGYNNAVRGVAGLIGLTALFSFLFAVPNPTSRQRAPDSWARVRVWLDPEAFKNKQFCWFTAAISFMFLGFYAVFFNLEEWAATKGVGYKEGIASEADEGTDRQMTAGLATYYLLAIMNAMSTFGRIGAAWASDHIGGVQVHTMVASVCSLLVLILWSLTTTFAGAMCFITFFGFFSGALIGLPPASMAYILGKSKARQAKLGQWTGMMYTAAAIPSLVGPIVAGHLVSEFKNYITVQIWSGSCLACAAACMGVTWWYKSQELAAGGPPTTIDEPVIPLERVGSQASWVTRGYDTDRPQGDEAKEEVYGKN